MTDGSSGPPAVLAEITLAELGALIRVAIDDGYESEKQEGRRLLLDVVEQLAAVDAGAGGAADILCGPVWRIAEVRVRGVGGIGELEPSPLVFSPVPGITVVRGLNGQGKTSLARGIDCALRGRGDGAGEVVGDLWQSALVTEGQATGSVDLVLLSGTARLEVSAVFSGNDAQPHVTATLVDGEHSRQVDLTGAWRRALASARACYSYGALQSRLVETRALQGFLEELLVLGPEWARVRAEVDERAAEATRAAKAVDAAARQAGQRAEEIASRFRDDERRPAAPEPVTWPRARDGVEVDVWLAGTGLATVGRQEPMHVAGDHEARIAELDVEFRQAEEDLAAADGALVAPGMAAAVHHIERIATVGDLDDSECPLCGSRSEWREHVRVLTSTLQDRKRRADRVTSAVVALRDWAEVELVPLVAGGPPGGPGTELEAFRSATADGCHAHSPAHSLARPLLDRLVSDGYRAWLDGVRSTSDATAQWRSELAAVVHEFAAEVRGRTGVAAGAGVWAKAQKTLDELQLGIRQSRQDAVTARLRDALTRMLPDASIELSTIRHQGGVKQQRGVDVELQIGGRRATLGMLSSGQRNALLLAPVITAHSSGPIGFVVIDDPVHALDDTRLDLFARELAELARERQVIVLTHDPGLEEHLRARCPWTEVVELRRDPIDRTVSCTEQTRPWEVLLTDARHMRVRSDSDGWRHTEDLHSVVAGLCRAAVDGALRQAVITRAHQVGADVQQSLTDLARAESTRDRIDHVTALAGGEDLLPALAAGRAAHLKFWNMGSHGQLPDGHDLESTIAAAEASCAEVAAHDWANG